MPLSQVVAWLTLARRDIARAKAEFEEARGPVLNLAEELEDSQRN
jgi:hypothetical protein